MTLNGAVAASVKVGALAEDTVKNIENVTGGAGNDVITGDALANTLIGNAGNDFLAGGAGNDFLRGGLGNDTLDGGVGIDTADYSDKAAAVTVTLNGAVAASVKVGALAEDTVKNIENVTGGAGNDVITGDALANTLIGNAGNDFLAGGAGNDFLRGGLGNDMLDGGVGIDTADYSDKAAAVTVTLNDAVAASVKVGALAEDSVKNVENVTGGAGNDVITGDALANTLIGNAGNDFLTGGAGNDVFIGGAGNDTMDGGTGLDTLDYSSDVRAGATHGIRANLLAVAQGGLAADTVLGSFGDVDHIPNIRNLIGTQFADTILGGGKANVLQGGAGNDLIDGEGGSDTLTGGAGKDTFAFHLMTGGGGGGGIDTITDFSVADDTIQLENAVFTAFTTPGVMSDALFHAHIIYNAATGALSYDANGAAAGGITQFATLGTGLALTHSDFIVV